MAKREWIGNYDLHAVVEYPYKKGTFHKVFSLGHCINHAEASEKAAACLMREYQDVTYREIIFHEFWITDGWGNIITR